MSELHLSRREFLAAANAGALLLLLESCSLGPFGQSSAGSSIPAGSSAREQALLRLRDAVRASPDHLAQRAAELVKAKDATKIVQFVRDRIGVIPGPYPGVDPIYGRGWGSAATLRGGQGMLRERADVLADMLTRAGFPAQVMRADRPAAVTLGELYKQRTVAFAPDQGKVDQAKSLLRQAGFPAPDSPHAFDAGPDPVAAILGALPPTVQLARLRDDLLPQQVPVVTFEQGGKKQYAFALGSLDASDTAPANLKTAPDATATPNVTITVSALSNPAPGSTTPRGSLVDLVSGTWTSEVLMGNQVQLLFPPIEGAKAILDSGLGSLPVRLPVLRVQTQAAPAGAPSNLIVAGPAVTMQGDVLAPPGGGSPTTGAIDGPFGTITSLSDTDLKAAIARAQSIKVSANASAFPEVAVDVVITDAGGAPVDGINAASFAVKEQGNPVAGFTLYSNVNHQPRPRVLIVYDAQGVDLWPSAAVKSAFDSGLAAAIEALAVKTPFDVQVVGLGAPPSPGAWAAPNAAAIAGAFPTSFEAADDPWRTVGGMALDQGVCAMVLVSDCQTTDSDASAVPTLQRRLVRSKVPVFVVPTGQSEEPTVAQIVSLSGGSRIDKSDAAAPSKIAALLAPVIPKWVGGAYRLRYQAVTGSPAQRTVTVALAKLSGNAVYQVPDQPVPPPSFIGLYVRIDVQGGLTSFRRLAGAEFALRGGPQGVIDDPALVDQTRAAMNGVTTIALEPGTPTSAAMLDDLISAGLSVEPLWQIWGPDASNDDILKAASRGFHRAPVALASMLRPGVVDPAALVGLRVAIVQERVVGGFAEEHLDLAIGVNSVPAIATDRHAAFRSALTTSMAASAAEAATFHDSAYTRLSGQTLVPVVSGDPGAASAYLKTVPPGRAAAWKAMLTVYQDYHLLLPQAGAADAFWIVEPNTGVAKAMLLDGTGGGLIRSKCSYDNFDQAGIALAMLSIMCSGPISSYSLYCVGINTAATGMAVASLFNSHWDPGTPVSIALGVYNPWESMAGTSAGIGIMLLMITLQSGCK